MQYSSQAALSWRQKQLVYHANGITWPYMKKANFFAQDCIPHSVNVVSLPMMYMHTHRWNVQWCHAFQLRISNEMSYSLLDGTHMNLHTPFSYSGIALSTLYILYITLQLLMFGLIHRTRKIATTYTWWRSWNSLTWRHRTTAHMPPQLPA